MSFPEKEVYVISNLFCVLDRQQGNKISISKLTQKLIIEAFQKDEQKKIIAFSLTGNRWKLMKLKLKWGKSLRFTASFIFPLLVLSWKVLKLLSSQWEHRRRAKDLWLISRWFVVFLGFGSIFISKKGLFHCLVCPGILVGEHYLVNFHMLFSLPFSGIHFLLTFIYVSITHSCTIECYHSLPTL